MNKKLATILFCLLSVLEVLPQTAYCGPFYSGMVEFKQLSGSSFMGMCGGDEFEAICRTSDGYTFVSKGFNYGPPYEYAMLDASGDFVGSGILVGSGMPPASAYQLERQNAKRAEIDAARLSFSQSLDPLLARTRQRTLDDCGIENAVLRVAVILVEFPDRLHQEGSEEDPTTPGRFHYWGQTLENIETMMMSEGVYRGQQSADGNQQGHIPNRHPEGGEWTFRSFKEYWQTASYGLWNPICTVVNPRDAQGNPLWLTMGTSSCQWSTLDPNNPCLRHVDHGAFTSDVMTEVNQLGWLDRPPGLEFDYAIIFNPGGLLGDCEPGGPVCQYGGTTNPDTDPPSMGWPLLDRPPSWDADVDNWHFTHIGTICHEFGHLLGMGDLQGGGLGSLMAQGNGAGIRGFENPTGLGAIGEAGTGILECLAEDSLGGMIFLNSDQPVVARPPTTWGHTVYAFGNNATAPRYFVECRRIGIRDDAIERTEIDDHMLMTQYHAYNESTAENQLIIWDTQEESAQGIEAAVRTNSLSYLVNTYGDSGSVGWSDFWFLWPGSRNNNGLLNWTPYSFPNTSDTRAALLNITPDDLNHEVRFDFDYQHVQPGPIQVDDTVFAYGYYLLTDDMEVVNGGVLHIGSPYHTTNYSKFRFATNKGLIVEGGGIRGKPRVSTFSSDFAPLSGHTSWGGVTVFSTDDSNMFCSRAYRTPVGVFVNGGNLTLDHADLEQCEIGAAWLNGTGAISSSDLSGNDRFGLYMIGSSVDIEETEFNDNDAGGIRMWRSDHCTFHDNSINNNGGLTSASYWSGLQMLGSTATMTCNEIEANDGPGIMLFSQSFADLNGLLNVGGWNRIRSNMVEIGDLGYDYGQVALFGGMFDAVCGFNTISEPTNTQWLVRSQYEHLPAPGWDVGLNYWGTQDENNILSRLPNGVDLHGVLSSVNNCETVYCFIDPNGDDDEELFWSGWNLEREAQYSVAVEPYETLITMFPNSTFTPIALERIQFCKKALEWTWSEIREYFLDLAADSSKDSAVVYLSRSNAAWCLVEDGDFAGALMELTSLMDESAPDYATLKVELDLLLLELAQDEYDFTSKTPGSPRQHTQLDAAEMSTKTRIVNSLSRVDEALWRYHATEKIQSEEVKGIPVTYALYQNYPNPFNPTTQIEYDLPEESLVQLKVFNTLGQEVASLVNGQIPAGHHVVTWNGKSDSGADVATGLFIYQIQAGSFNDVRKMVILR